MPHEPASIQQFVEDWRDRDLTERESAQTHFIQLCRLLDVPAPYDHPSEDDNYCFDAVTTTAGSLAYANAKKGASQQKHKKSGRASKTAQSPALFKDADPPAAASDQAEQQLFLSKIVPAKGGSHGFADVWKRGHFCWEYKRQNHADLNAALAQLKQYRDSLDNPPLLIVCDVDRFEIHTNFTGYPSESYAFSLEDLANPPAEWATDRGITPIQCLRRAFTDPEWFRPKKTVNTITEELAKRIGDLSNQIADRKQPDGKKPDPHEVAHFLMQVVFALFAQNVQLLPEGLVTQIVRSNVRDKPRFTRQMRDLFQKMETGGDFGPSSIEWFNGGLFKGVAKQAIPQLDTDEIGTLSLVAEKDWASVEPSILGTLFERALNPEKRAQIGAHYTSRDDIMLIIEPVILAPLRREWNDAQREVSEIIPLRDAAKGAARKPFQDRMAAAVKKFHDRLCSVRILDPACGSGNFLYVAIQCLLDMEKVIIGFGARQEIGVTVKPRVGPTQLHGIEINDYAAELARISIWIGYLKWKRDNGPFDKRRPILDALDTIEGRDAILDRSKKGEPRAADWPEADYIVGNPPFLGSKMFRKWGLTDDYLDDLYAAFDLPKTSDLCCYWFELGRRAIQRHKSTRTGLLATQGIRGGDNRTVLERIKESGDIFMAWADRDWVLDGAAVQVSMIGFDNGSDKVHVLDNSIVPEIQADLSTEKAASGATPLVENAGMAFMGDTKGGSFDIAAEVAMPLLAGVNVNRRPNREVIRPWVNGLDIVRRPRGFVTLQPNAAELVKTRFGR